MSAAEQWPLTGGREYRKVSLTAQAAGLTGTGMTQYIARSLSLHRLLLASAAVALFVAAVLVLHLQRESAERHQQQTGTIIEQLCRQTAMLVADRLRESFGKAVFETLEGIGHPELQEYRLSRIADYFDAGRAHRYVDRFFIWSRQMEPSQAGQVLFYRGPHEGSGDFPIPAAEDGRQGSLYSRPAIGQGIWSEAARLSSHKRSFAVIERIYDGKPLQIVIHYIWSDQRRLDFTALVGYTVDLAYVRDQLFKDLFGDSSATFPDAEHFELEITISDDEGRPVFGRVHSAGVTYASERFELLFFPRALRVWLVDQAPATFWTVTVSERSARVAEANEGYWLFGTVVLLNLIGLVCAVALDRRSRRLSEMQSDFITNVSHQLKTPLALLSGAAETLGRGRVTSPQKLREYAGIVQAQAARLSALVDQAIFFSVSDTGRGGLHLQPVDLSRLVGDAVAAFRNGVPKDLEVRFCSESPDAVVKADPSALEQVVWNLLENAVKYGRENNSISVVVTATSRIATITVRDQGDGIAQEELTRVFDRFYRSEQHAKLRRGFGLGLAYVQKIVTVHGGRVAVSSEIGHGAEFRIDLPVSQENG